MKNVIFKKQSLPRIDSKKLSYYILAKHGPMEHLKLHKLIFYVEAYHLAYFETSLIDDNFQAWVHGPVVLPVWLNIKSLANVYDSIQLKTEVKKESIEYLKENVTGSQFEIINDILDEFGSKSAYELECLTHEEEPWKNARKGLPPDNPSKNIISKKEMMEYYKTKLYS